MVEETFWASTVRADGAVLLAGWTDVSWDAADSDSKTISPPFTDPEVAPTTLPPTVFEPANNLTPHCTSKRNHDIRHCTPTGDHTTIPGFVVGSVERPRRALDFLVWF